MIKEKVLQIRINGDEPQYAGDIVFDSDTAKLQFTPTAEVVTALLDSNSASEAIVGGALRRAIVEWLLREITNETTLQILRQKYPVKITESPTQLILRKALRDTKRKDKITGLEVSQITPLRVTLFDGREIKAGDLITNVSEVRPGLIFITFQPSDEVISRLSGHYFRTKTRLELINKFKQRVIIALQAGLKEIKQKNQTTSLRVSNIKGISYNNLPRKSQDVMNQQMLLEAAEKVGIEICMD